MRETKMHLQPKFHSIRGVCISMMRLCVCIVRFLLHPNPLWKWVKMQKEMRVASRCIFENNIMRNLSFYKRDECHNNLTALKTSGGEHEEKERFIIWCFSIIKSKSYQWKIYNNKCSISSHMDSIIILKKDEINK